MAFFKKPKSDNSVKGQLRNLIRDIGFETAREVKEVGKEVIKGVTQLPVGLVSEARTAPGSGTGDWEKDWLKDADKEKSRLPLSEKEGGHSKINPSEIVKKDDAAEIERVKRQISGTLNQTYNRPSSASEYAQELARKQQAEQKPVYDKGWEEREEQKKRQAQRPQTGVNLAATGSKRKAGDWQHGTRRKKGPTPQDLNRAEFAGKGKQ